MCLFNHFKIRCYLQEVVICLILLCDGQWHERLGLLFDIFKSQGTNEVNYDDIILMSQFVAVTLHKLWMVSESWKQSELNSLTETIADSAYTKVILSTIMTSCTLFFDMHVQSLIR